MIITFRKSSNSEVILFSAVLEPQHTFHWVFRIYVKTFFIVCKVMYAVLPGAIPLDIQYLRNINLCGHQTPLICLCSFALFTEVDKICAFLSLWRLPSKRTRGDSAEPALTVHKITKLYYYLTRFSGRCVKILHKCMCPFSSQIFFKPKVGCMIMHRQ